MECAMCRKGHHAQSRPFLCTMDARNRCYEGRIANARMLIEKEELQDKINQMLSDSLENPSSSSWSWSSPAPSAPANKSLVLESWVSDQRVAEERTSQIIRQAERLQGEVTSARQDIEARKRLLARRRADLESARDGIDRRRDRRLDDVRRATRESGAEWDMTAHHTARHRRFLCSEAAKLYGLVRVPRKGTPARYEYRVGRVEAISLLSLNFLDPEAISTSLAHMAHVLVLSSHYLGIRLPAEITLPHRDYPRPTIFSLASSYSHRDAPLPDALAGAAIDPRSPSQQSHHVPRPRPLFIDKPISVLAKEDPSAYKFLVEGVALLAYDVAWACASQGISVSVSPTAPDGPTFEDVCHIGRNLYNLLYNPAAISAGNLSQQHSPRDAAAPDNEAAMSTAGTANTVGRFSHGSAHDFLGSAEGIEYMRSYKLPGPVKLADELRKRLVAELTSPDWEILDDDAWAPDDGTEPAVLVVGRGRRYSNNAGNRQPASGSDGPSPLGNNAAAAGTSTGTNTGTSTGRARSAWTVLKGRR